MGIVGVRYLFLLQEFKAIFQYRIQNLAYWYTVDLPSKTTMSSATFDFEVTIFTEPISPRILYQKVSWTISNNQNCMIVIVSENNVETLPKMSKRALAKILVEKISQSFEDMNA